eukprot:5401428-Pyramimonas_sp.AAC.1
MEQTDIYEISMTLMVKHGSPHLSLSIVYARSSGSRELLAGSGGSKPSDRTKKTIKIIGVAHYTYPDDRADTNMARYERVLKPLPVPYLDQAIERMSSKTRRCGVSHPRRSDI